MVVSVGFGDVPLIAECLEPSEIRCSPSARWDQLYRRLLAVMMDDVRGALLRGDLRPLRRMFLWLQGIRPESHTQIPRATGLSACRGSCSKDNPVALQFSSILEQLFAYTPADQRLSLGLQTHLRADDLGLLPGLFTPHPESKLLPIEEIRLLASHNPLAAFSRLSQHTLQYRLSSALYALKAESAMRCCAHSPPLWMPRLCAASSLVLCCCKIPFNADVIKMTLGDGLCGLVGYGFGAVLADLWTTDLGRFQRVRDRRGC